MSSTDSGQSPDPAGLPETLIKRLRAKKVIPFVGAGVSMSVLHRDTKDRLYPSWSELLRRAADRLRAERQYDHARAVEGLLGIGQPEDFLEAAKKAREGLGPIWFTFLTEQFDHSRDIVDDESLELARLIWGLGSRVVITTNFDMVLHWSCPQKDRVVPWDIQAAAEQVALLNGELDKPVVWHLHGLVSNRAGIILTPDGYKYLYPPEDDFRVRYQAALQALRSLLTSHSFLFVGFSFNDPHVSSQIRLVEKIFRGGPGPHYVLLPASERGRVARPGRSGVREILYEDHGPPLLEALRALIAAAAGPPAPPARGPRIVPSPLPHVPPAPSIFIGREKEVSRFERAFLAPTSGYSVFSIEGEAGTGKTTLLEKLLHLVHSNKGLWALADEEQRSVSELLDRLARQFEQIVGEFLTFRKRLLRYKGLIHEAMSELRAQVPALPDIVRIAAGTIDNRALESEPAFTAYVRKKFSDPEDVGLIENPVDILTRAFLDDLSARAAGRKIVIFLDSYERLAPFANRWLHDLIHGSFGVVDGGALLVLASRGSLARINRDRSHNVHPNYRIRLDEFTPEEAEAFLREYGIMDPEQVREIVGLSRLPALLNLRASARDNRSVIFKVLFERFLLSPHGGHVTDPELQDVALAASLPRRFNRDLLTVMLDPGRERPDQIRGYFEWLSQADCVRIEPDGWAFHEHVRFLMLDYYRLISPERFALLNGRLDKYYSSSRPTGSDGPIRSLSDQMEAVYHRLLVDPDRHLGKALLVYMKALRSGPSLVFRWARTVQQVAEEVRSETLNRLGRLLGTISEETRDRTYDSALDVFIWLSGPRSLQIRRHPDKWLSYFEGRHYLLTGKQEEAERCLRGLPDDPFVETDLRFLAAIDLGELHTRAGEVEKAIHLNKRALSLARGNGLKIKRALAIYQLSTNHKRLGHYQEALCFSEESIHLFRAEGLDFQLGRALLDRGNTLVYLDELGKAEEAFKSSLDYLDKTSLLSVGETKHRIGWLQRLRGKLEESLASHLEAIATIEPLEEPYVLAKARHSLANVYTELHRTDEALEEFQKALQIFRGKKAGRHAALVRKDMAWALYRSSRAREAHAHLDEAIATLEEIGDTAGQAEGYLIKGSAYLLERDFGRAERHLGLAREKADRSANPLLHANVTSLLALCLALLGRPADAGRIAGEAEGYARDKKIPRLVARTHVTRGAICLACGELDRAVEHFRAAFDEAARWNRSFPRDITAEVALALRTVPSAPGPVAQRPPSVVARELALYATKTGAAREKDVERLLQLFDQLDVYDDKGAHLGTAPRDVAHFEGRWHRSFHCWIVFRADDGGAEIAFQRRGPFKRDWPNFLDITAAGHYHAGEGPEGGSRELREELGLTVAPDWLWKTGVRTIDEPYNGVINREFQHIYFYDLGAASDLSAYQVSYPEAAGVYHLKAREVRELLDGRRESVTGPGVRFDEAVGRCIPVAGERFRLTDFISNAHVYLRLVADLAEAFVRGQISPDGPGGGLEGTDRRRVLDDGSQWSPEPGWPSHG
jgi:tetratricopeptide (TPR) repeat protein/8-oxo-dGTP pyrophosphatase MutT (NUDIX family)